MLVLSNRDRRVRDAEERTVQFPPLSLTLDEVMVYKLSPLSISSSFQSIVSVQLLRLSFRVSAETFGSWEKEKHLLGYFQIFLQMVS